MNKTAGQKEIIIISLLVSVLVMISGVLLITLNKSAIVDWLADSGPKNSSNEMFLVNEESRIVDIVEKTNPAVVSIVITKNLPEIRQFGPFSVRVPGGGVEKEVGGGSGFFISDNGLIMTNKHVVADDDAEYSVITSDGVRHEAKILARDPLNDLAVIKISGDSYTSLDFDDSSGLKLGQTVVAIGNALGEFSNSVSVGVVSGLSRSITAGNGLGQSELLNEVIQTDAAINPGNSGGPLLDLNGRVIGVNVAVARGSENIGFALPSNLARQVAESVKESGRIVRPFLGVRYIELNSDISKENNLPVEQGAYVIGGGDINTPAVSPGSAADEAGLREGDIIVSIDGENIKEGNTLSSIISEKQVGDEIVIEFMRNGKETTATAVLGEAPQG